jgi:hypothetical protein
MLSVANIEGLLRAGISAYAWICEEIERLGWTVRGYS